MDQQEIEDMILKVIERNPTDVEKNNANDSNQSNILKTFAKNGLS